METRYTLNQANKSKSIWCNRVAKPLKEGGGGMYLEAILTASPQMS